MESEAILELGVEDLPPKMVKTTLEQLQKLGEISLKNYQINYKKLSSWGSSRRLILYIEGIRLRQKDTIEKKIGPPRNIVYDSKGRLTPTGKRYVEAKGVSEKNLGIETLKKGEYVYIKRVNKGEKTISVLPVLFKELISSLQFSKSMRWKKEKFSFGRPLRYILSLLGEEPVEFEIGGIKTGRKTKGHRYLHPKWFEIPKASSYREIVRRASVIIDPEDRKKRITKQISKIISQLREKGYKAQFAKDEKLLEELSYLVEHPTAFLGEFDSQYLSLPSFILKANLAEYQKHFAVTDGKSILPFFIGIREGGKYNLREVIEGNKKVLHARLNDAQFFYREDKKIPLDERVPLLKEIIVQEKLGSYYDKVKRLIKLTEKISLELNIQEEVKEKIKRAAYLCKADLSTNMVREFPQLQGILGKEFALYFGEDSPVAHAIEEHRKPRFSGDALPRCLEGAILAIIDKIDTLSGAFWGGFVPSGSEDPWGLRREAQGIIEIILDNKFNIELTKLVNESMNLYGNSGTEPQKKLNQFLDTRVITLLRGVGIKPDQINAAAKINKDNPTDFTSRAKALQSIASKKEFQKQIVAIVRLLNILKQAKEWGIKIPLKIDEGKFEEKEEVNLYQRWEKIKRTVDSLLDKGEYVKAYKNLSSLKESIHAFFEKVLVMSKNLEVRLNRLSLLLDIGSRFLKIADFSELQINNA